MHDTEVLFSWAQRKKNGQSWSAVRQNYCRLQEEGKRKNWNQNAVLTRSPRLTLLITTPTLTLLLVKTSLKNAFHCSVCLHTKPKWQTCPLSGFLPSLSSTYRPQVGWGWGVLPVMASMGRLRRKGVSFSAIWNGRKFNSWSIMKGSGKSVISVC